MNRFTVLLVVLPMLLTTACAQQGPSPNAKNSMADQTETEKPGMEVATFGGGCFWCLEAVFQDLQGVDKVVSGYAGGETEAPDYRAVCSGQTGHAEVVQIYFDPKVISYPELLEVFWTTHDPTTLNRQGHDIGTQYRSIILTHSDRQKAEAEISVRDVASRIWDGQVVTEIVPFKSFFPAESYHQDYYSLNPRQPYCQAVISPKVAKVREKFADKLKPSAKGD